MPNVPLPSRYTGKIRKRWWKYNFSKDNDFYKIKGGIIDGKVMTAEEIITLAKLPSRQELLGMLAGALLGNISKLAVGLNEVCKQKENA